MKKKKQTWLTTTTMRRSINKAWFAGAVERTTTIWVDHWLKPWDQPLRLPVFFIRWESQLKSFHWRKCYKLSDQVLFSTFECAFLQMWFYELFPISMQKYMSLYKKWNLVLQSKISIILYKYHEWEILCIQAAYQSFLLKFFLNFAGYRKDCSYNVNDWESF